MGSFFNLTFFFFNEFFGKVLGIFWIEIVAFSFSKLLEFSDFIVKVTILEFLIKSFKIGFEVFSGLLCVLWDSDFVTFLFGFTDHSISFIFNFLGNLLLFVSWLGNLSEAHVTSGSDESFSGTSDGIFDFTLVLSNNSLNATSDLLSFWEIAINFTTSSSDIISKTIKGALNLLCWKVFCSLFDHTYDNLSWWNALLKQLLSSGWLCSLSKSKIFGNSLNVFFCLGNFSNDFIFVCLELTISLLECTLEAINDNFTTWSSWRKGKSDV